MEIVDPETTVDGNPLIISGDDAHVKVTLVPVVGEGETNLPKINGIVKIFVGSKDYTVAIVNGVGHYYVNNLAQDAYDITASFAGDANHDESTSAVTTLEACMILTETTCKLDKTPVNEGDTIMLNVGETINVSVEINEVGLQRPVIDAETVEKKEYRYPEADVKPLSIDAIVTVKAQTPYDHENNINNNNYTTGIVNGRGLHTFSHFPAGPRCINAVFAGNDVIAGSMSEGEWIKVNKVETSASVEVTSPVIAK